MTTISPLCSKDGIRELKSVISAKQEVHGECSEEVSDTHKLLANVHMAQANMEAALKHYRQVRIRHVVDSGAAERSKNLARREDVWGMCETLEPNRL